jgi:hypothetical protein
MAAMSIGQASVGTFSNDGRLSRQRLNLEEAMTDYRDPNYRDPARRDYRDPDVPVDSESWSSATWGWIAGFAVVALVLIFAFSSSDTNRTASDATNPPVTTGQGGSRMAPPADPGAPSMNRPAPAPAPAAPQP